MGHARSALIFDRPTTDSRRNHGGFSHIRRRYHRGTRKENTMEYPKQIYISAATGEEIKHPDYHAAREKIYDLGKASVESLDGWANLTEVVREDADIDWEKLDGLPCKCVHPELGTLTYKLDRDVSELEVDQPWAWFSGLDYSTWISALIDAWKATSDWTLWIKGEIPLKRKTADQLPAGTCIDGLPPLYDESIKGVVVEQPHGMPKMVVWADSIGTTFAKKVEVLKEYGIGTFKETA